MNPVISGAETTRRVYQDVVTGYYPDRRPQTREEAMSELRTSLGDSFDPESVSKYSDSELKAFASKNRRFANYTEGLSSAERDSLLERVSNDVDERIETAKAKASSQGFWTRFLGLFGFGGSQEIRTEGQIPSSVMQQVADGFPEGAPQTREGLVADLQRNLGSSFEASSVADYSLEELYDYASRTRIFNAKLESFSEEGQMELLGEMKDNIGERIDAAKARLDNNYTSAEEGGGWTSYREDKSNLGWFGNFF